jgi:hypothetical protein
LANAGVPLIRDCSVSGTADVVICMKKSYFNPATHIGSQPVRVLKWNIAHQWENLHPAFSQEFQTTLRKHGLQPFVKYDCSERAIVEAGFSDSLVPFVDQDKEITIQETFLSLVWTMCYSHLVLFEEQIHKPLLNRLHRQNHRIDYAAIAAAANVYRYGVSLVRRFSPWDKDKLPNPEMYAPSEFYVEKANGVFVFAMAFILCHELAHIESGHLDGYIAEADRLLAEQEADRRAVETMLRGATDSGTKLNYGMGMLLGFCSLLTLKGELTSDTHPNLAGRIQRVLSEQNFDELSPLWGVATMSFRLWDDLHNKPNHRIQWPQNCDSYKDLFYAVVNQIR